MNGWLLGPTELFPSGYNKLILNRPSSGEEESVLILPPLLQNDAITIYKVIALLDYSFRTRATNLDGDYTYLYSWDGCLGNVPPILRMKSQCTRAQSANSTKLATKFGGNFSWIGSL